MHKTFGAIVTTHSTLFRIWAPACQNLELELQHADGQQRLPMIAGENGFFERDVPGVGAGTRYRYWLPSPQGLVPRPDPASRFQPEGVHGWSQVVDPQHFPWTDGSWRGVAKQSLVIYELHLGAFTSAGTYLAAIERLAELQELGINAVELMPLAESAGKWNWGYDGVNFFAPRHTYGTPDEFRQFVDAAHGRGMAVLLDVVYNHLGPEGNYLRDFGDYLSDRHSTAWGDAPNFDSPDPAVARIVRDFFLANVSHWIEDYHLDGLRIDAVHCMADDSEPHIARELAVVMDGMRGRFQRELHLIAESNVYDPQLLGSLAEEGHGYDAVWCDDFLHAVYAVLRPNEHMSQRRYEPSDMRATLRRGFVFQGTLSTARQRIPLAEDSPQAPLESLVFSIQNHDFIGNHPLGKRLHQLTSDDAHRAAAALLLLYPAIPMLFMGEEFACDNPFHFFVDYGDANLRDAVERGRHAEYPQHDWSEGGSPLDPSA
ncbi:MAG: malto-oligosyltrehalose trehalohydrolase, partial [Planctomycetales bacterium]|nr:malto-oligosyltrehalose trehalohydrolase [Planctomycetales bacterium]